MYLAVQAPAKVNLYLKILARRPDGYHELVTLMQPLDLADTLEVSLGHKGLSLRCNRAELSQDNLVIKAAQSFYQAIGRPPAASFKLHKRIPVAAGLGGGSSDAAAALLALNALYDGALAPQELAGLAAGLGADVPFFLGGVSALCSGVGEMVEPWPDFPLLHYVLINPRFGLSTARVYQEFDLSWTNGGKKFKIVCPLGLDEHAKHLLSNDLEAAALRVHPSLGDMKEALMAVGAEGTLMSGSGPTFFGLFADVAQADEAARKIRHQTRWWVRACRGVKA